VCYDDDLTDALFRILYRLSSNMRHPSTSYISIEKRLEWPVAKTFFPFTFIIVTVSSNKLNLNTVNLIPDPLESFLECLRKRQIS